MNFTHPVLLQKYGSWIRVQVAFYDFLFMKGYPNLNSISEGKEEMMMDFADGKDPYEKPVRALEKLYNNPNEAWTEFLEEELGNDE